MADIEYRRVWMIDGAADQKISVLGRIEERIGSVQAPALPMQRKTVNMWWRKDSAPLRRLSPRRTPRR